MNRTNAQELKEKAHASLILGNMWLHSRIRRGSPPIEPGWLIVGKKEENLDVKYFAQRIHGIGS